MGELADICTACLCGDRNLSYIDTTDYYHLYLQILNEIQVYNVSQLCIRVCWECQALFRKFVTFKKQVKTSYNKLLVYAQEVNSKPCKNFSHLRTIQVTNISIPEVVIKEEPEELKQEIELDTHCEPEAFVNNLNMVALKKGKDIKKETIKKSKKKLKKQKSLIKYNIKVKQKKILSEDVGSNASADNTSDLELNTDYNVNDYNNIHEDMNGDIEVEVQAKVKLPNGDSKPPRAPPSKEVLPDKPQCAECGKKFSSRKTYRYHLNVLHKGQNRYPCPRCGKVYQWKSNLGRHMRSHKARDSGELYCETCDKRFSSVATYRQHMRAARSHVPESEFSFMCNECGKKFVNKTRLRDHIDWEHLKKIKFRCQLCNKPFKCHTSLYVHMQNVHKNKEKKDNLCHVCGKSYQNAAKLRYHIVAMHTSETPYQCEQCSAAFGWYSSLYRHVREVHYKMKVQA